MSFFYYLLLLIVWLRNFIACVIISLLTWLVWWCHSKCVVLSSRRGTFPFKTKTSYESESSIEIIFFGENIGADVVRLLLRWLMLIWWYLLRKLVLIWCCFSTIVQLSFLRSATVVACLLPSMEILAREKDVKVSFHPKLEWQKKEKPIKSEAIFVVALFTQLLI